MQKYQFYFMNFKVKLQNEVANMMDSNLNLQLIYEDD